MVLIYKKRGGIISVIVIIVITVIIRGLIHIHFLCVALVTPAPGKKDATCSSVKESNTQISVIFPSPGINTLFILRLCHSPKHGEYCGVGSA